jgi:ribulose-bisphosphate carboxylase large chain
MSWALRATYRFALAPGESAERFAAHLAREQTVECAEGSSPAGAEERTLARVEAVRRLAAPGERYEATLAFPAGALGDGDLLQAVNALFGNAALRPGVAWVGAEWSPELLAGFPGPRHGVAGLRALCGVPTRPLLAVALKPLGATPAELARRAAEAALGGADLIKDDHGLADQPAAPFRERVLAVSEAIARARRALGGRALYVPNLTGPVDRLADRLDDLAAAGVRAALVAPMLLGLDTVRALAASSGLALLAHPALAGAFLGGERGIAPELLAGDLFRLAGADAVLFPAAPSRFAVSARDVDALAARLARPWGEIAPAFLALGGGFDADRLAAELPRRGPDTIYLASGAVFAEREARRPIAALAERLASVAGA